MKILLSFFFVLAICGSVLSQEAFIMEDWDKAVAKSKKTGKILFVDYYTDWCGWCKVMDKQTFNDSIVKPIMEEDFILLKINAEKGIGPKLARKYRVNVFPSFMFYSPDGKVIKKIMGFQKPDAFLKTMETVRELHKDKKYYEGVSNNLDLKYPKFFTDSYLDKTDKPELDYNAINKYILDQKDFNSEINFSILSRFTTNDEVNEKFMENREELVRLFGEEDVEQKISSILNAKYSEVLKTLDYEAFESLLKFVETNFVEKKEFYHLAIKTGYYEKKEDWTSYIKTIDEQIQANKLEAQQINQYSWNIYEKCTDSEVVKNAMEWMKKVCESSPEWMFLDTYASLLFKAGNHEEAKIQAEKAIKIGEAAGEKIDSTKALLENILEQIQ